jgi:hypothetical protein
VKDGPSVWLASALVAVVMLLVVAGVLVLAAVAHPIR